MPYGNKAGITWCHINATLAGPSLDFFPYLCDITNTVALERH